jgi:ribosomal protein S18 acetylase RimI-like enzyme
MKICPMDKAFILFRCVHFGPLGLSNIEKMSMNVPGLSEEQFDRNKKFLARLIDIYGSCAMLAIEGDLVVGHARFYPQIIFDLAGQRHICCQEPRFAVTQQMVEMELATIENPANRILRIHCWLVHKDYRGWGLSHALLDGILEWAQSHNWKVVRASAAPDNYWVASQACAPMLRTYIKHGFQKIKTVPSPEVEEILMKFQEGKLGIKGKKEFEKFCAGEDLSKLAVFHEVECRL